MWRTTIPPLLFARHARDHARGHWSDIITHLVLVASAPVVVEVAPVGDRVPHAAVDGLHINLEAHGIGKTNLRASLHLLPDLQILLDTAGGESSGQNHFILQNTHAPLYQTNTA